MLRSEVVPRLLLGRLLELAHAWTETGGDEKRGLAKKRRTRVRKSQTLVAVLTCKYRLQCRRDFLASRYRQCEARRGRRSRPPSPSLHPSASALLAPLPFAGAELDPVALYCRFLFPPTHHNLGRWPSSPSLLCIYDLASHLADCASSLLEIPTMPSIPPALQAGHLREPRV